MIQCEGYKQTTQNLQHDKVTMCPTTENTEASLSLHLDLRKVDRVTALMAWLAYHKIERRALAAKIGVQPSAITRIIRGVRSTEWIIEAMVKEGIPRELLPEPGPGPGRPRSPGGTEEQTSPKFNYS